MCREQHSDRPPLIERSMVRPLAASFLILIGLPGFAAAQGFDQRVREETWLILNGSFSSREGGPQTERSGTPRGSLEMLEPRSRCGGRSRIRNADVDADDHVGAYARPAACSCSIYPDNFRNTTRIRLRHHFAKLGRSLCDISTEGRADETGARCHHRRGHRRPRGPGAGLAAAQVIAAIAAAAARF